MEIYYAVLEIIDGRYFRIESELIKDERTYRLRAKFSQDKTRNTLYLYLNKVDEHMAFGIENKKQLIFPAIVRRWDAVTGKEKLVLELLKGEKGSNPDKRALFKMETDGSWGSLKSVLEPSQYLCVTGDNIELSTKPQHYFRITNECQQRVKSTVPAKRNNGIDPVEIQNPRSYQQGDTFLQEVPIMIPQSFNFKLVEFEMASKSNYIQRKITCLQSSTPQDSLPKLHPSRVRETFYSLLLPQVKTIKRLAMHFIQLNVNSLGKAFFAFRHVCLRLMWKLKLTAPQTPTPLESTKMERVDQVFSSKPIPTEPLKVL